MRTLHTFVCVGMALAFVGEGGAFAQTPRTRSNSAAAVSQINVPFHDARNAGPNSVRFAAAQLTDHGPVVVLFGATSASWHKVRAAIQQVMSEGLPFSGVFMGPTDQAPTMEIYAQAHHVTQPINLNDISQREIEQLLRDVTREYYGL